MSRITSLLLALPFAYLLTTRLTSAKSWLMLVACEWLPAVLALWLLVGLSPGQALAAFALGYLTLLSLYEIGYIANDRLSVRVEAAPRRRGPRLPGRGAWAVIVVWCGTRLAAFAWLTHYLDLWHEPRAWMFYGTLVAAFALHNVLASAALRIGTFVNLALIRLLAPVFPFADAEQLAVLLVPALTGLVLYRTLSYMESKSLLAMSGRRTPIFALWLHVFMLGPNLLAAAALNSWWPVYAIGYYIAFWLAAAAVYSNVTVGRGAADAV